MRDKSDTIVSIGCLPFFFSVVFLVGCLLNITKVVREINGGNLLLLCGIFAAVLCIIIFLVILRYEILIHGYIKEIDTKEREVKHIDALCKKKIWDITNEHNRQMSEQVRINDNLNALLKTKNPFRQLSRMVSDYETVIYKKDENYLKYKSRPAKVAADKVREIRKILAENVAEYKQMLYKYEFLLNVFPELREYIEDDETLISISDYATLSEFNENRDRVLDWISENDYKSLSVDERNQLALDRYKNRTKSNWELGIEYELYIGFLLREGLYPFNRKWQVLQFGELNGLSDLGRDIIAESTEFFGKRTILIIQCKRWSEKKLVHENAICQLYGTTIEYRIKHRNSVDCNIIPVFISTTRLSPMAQSFAKYLGVEVYIVSMGSYPMIKCNINGGQKIYHLPFDQQYHRTEIKNEGEFYATTVKEATQKGFRRAMKHFIN